MQTAAPNMAASWQPARPVFEFYCVEQKNCSAARRPLRRRHLIQFFLDDLVDWIGPHGKRERFRVRQVSLDCVMH